MEHKFDVYVGRADDWTLVAAGETQYPGLTNLEGAPSSWEVRVVVAGADPTEHVLRRESAADWLPYGHPADDDVPPGGTMDHRAVVLEWPYGNTWMCCIESAVRGVSLCGRQLSRKATRVIYQPAHDHDSRHSSLCFDCSSGPWK